MPYVITDPPKPGTPEHLQVITASKVPSILGIDPFKSKFALWHEMHGDIEPPPVGPQQRKIFDWGHSAELAMADYWKKQNPGWVLNGGEIAFTDPNLPFPNLVTLDELALNTETQQRRVLEFKTANSFDSASKWGKTTEKNSVPANYLAQHLFQRGVSGVHDGQVILQSIGAPEIHDVTWDPLLYSKIVSACTRFYKSLVNNEPPSPDDDTTATYDAVRGLHPQIDKDSLWRLDYSEAKELLEANKLKNEAESRLKRAKNVILGKMGNANHAVYDGYRVASRQAGRGVKPTFVVKGKLEDLPRHNGDDATQTNENKEDNE